MLGFKLKTGRVYASKSAVVNPSYGVSELDVVAHAYGKRNIFDRLAGRFVLSTVNAISTPACFSVNDGRLGSIYICKG